MTTHEARAQLRKLGRRVKRLKNGRYQVEGCWPDVSEEGLVTLAMAFEIRKAFKP